MRFYCFLRESAKKSTDKYGPRAQMRDCQKFAETWPSGPHDVSDEYCATVVEPATTWDRPVWEAALDQGITLVQVGLRDAFLFSRVDRETRNLFASIPILRRAMDAGIPVYFAQEKLHLDPKDSDAIDRYIDEAREAIAYVRRLVKNTKPGRIARARDDQKLPTNSRLFGFGITDGRRVLNQAEAAVLREAAGIILREGRTGPAVRWLNTQGWRTTFGNPFSAATVAWIFRNRALIGETTINFQEETVVINHEAILDRATFEAINAALDGRRLREPRGTAFYALAGISFCGCGAKFEPCKSGNHRYYRCKAHCGEKPWRKDNLEFEVAEAFTCYLKQREGRLAYLQLAQESEQKLRRDLLSIERELGKANSEWLALLRKDLDGYPEHIIEGAKVGLGAKMGILERERQKLQKDLETLPQLAPADVERELAALAEPWQRCNTGGLAMSYAMSWERRSAAAGSLSPSILKQLSDEEARLLREMLLKLGARLTIEKGTVRVRGRLSVGAKQRSSATA